MHPSSLLLVGCGKMGSALLSRWQKTHPGGMHRFRIVEPFHSHLNTDLVSWFRSLDEVPEEYTPGVVVFAVKPQELGAMLPLYADRFHDKNPLYISIAAGKSLKFYRAFLGERANIVRAMPNTSALIGESTTALCATPNIPIPLKDVATQIMRAVGNVIWLEDESLMDAITALSGSGPAYVFLFLEALVNAGAEAGIDKTLARQIALSTVMGSCALANNSTESLEQLRKNVTSPGGTTEAALSILMEGGKLENLIKDAVLKAVNRSKEL